MSTTTMPPGQIYGSAPVPPPQSEPLPPPKKGSRLRKAARVTRTVIVVLILVAAAVIGGGYITRQRIADRAFVNAGTAVLSAAPIAVGSADAGVVSEVLVADRDDVAAGAMLARVTLTGTGGKPRVQELRAPAAGVVTQILTPGQVARAGEPVATLYDPAKLVFSVDVPLPTLRKLRLGMRASLTGPGLPGEINATLASVKPKVDGVVSAGDQLTVVLTPDSATLPTVRTLVPGLQFAVVVDTTTAPGGTPAVNSA
jgi:multidrug resistance efflux pump